MRLNTLKPLGPHVTGVIRFAGENHGTDSFKQLSHFEVLGRSYDLRTEAGIDEPRRLKEHAIAAELKKNLGADAKLASIPVRLVFDKPENSLSARYEAFDPEMNRLACCGNGENCARADFAAGTVSSHPCPGPDACTFANEAQLKCQLSVRLKVQIEGQTDPLSVFEFQSGGIHSYRNLTAKLTSLHSLLKGKLRGVPLSLASYERGSPAHGYESFYVVDLVLRDGDTLDSLAKAEAPTERTALDHDAMERAFEEITAESPFAVCDEYDSGVVVFTRPATPAPKARRQAPSGERSIESIVQAAVQARHDAVPVAAPTVDAPDNLGEASVPLREGAAKVSDEHELAPSPL